MEKYLSLWLKWVDSFNATLALIDINFNNKHTALALMEPQAKSWIKVNDSL